MKYLAKLFAPVLFLLALSGCWNSSDIQRMAYATAIVLDYEKGKYAAYVQILNFSNIAKLESVEVGKPMPVWIGKAEGVSVTEAFGNVMKTSQLRMYWGHVKAVIVTQNAIKDGLADIFDALNRHREIRYTIAVYGTREDPAALLAQKSLLNYSPIDSIIATPESSYKQESLIPPLKGFKFIAYLKEPAGSALLPSLSLDRSTWMEDEKPRTMFHVNGAFAFNGNRYANWLSLEDLSGLRWVKGRVTLTILNVPVEDNPDAAIIVRRVKRKIVPLIRQKDVGFRIRVRAIAEISEMRSDASIGKIRREAENAIRQEIMATYKAGIEKKCDVYQFSELLYRRNPKFWRKYFGNSSFPLDERSLKDVEVTVHIQSSGKYKMTTF